MTLKEIKVFQVDTEFIAATDEASAVKYYTEIVGEGDESLQDLEVDEIPREKWPEMKIVDMDEVGHPKR